ncbi:MAG: hypothetical protein ACO1QS_04795 [Verrucomicrobiota bacterium]
MMRVGKQVCVWLMMLGWPAALQAGTTNLVGDLLVEAARLETFSRNLYGQNSNNYTAPLTAEWQQFHDAAAALLAGDYVTAETLAAPLDYQVVFFQHTNPVTGLVGLRCVENGTGPLRGWGTFFLNTNPAVNVLVEAPHPQADFRSPQTAAEMFIKSGALGLLIAGANRHVNGDSTGDPCDLTNMVFHAVHVAWNGANGINTPWQIHGFSPAGHNEFPEGTLAVLSTGQGGDNYMSTNVVRLDEMLEINGLKSYGYNKNLADNDPLNLLVNEGVPGQTFTNLGARSNVQGIHSRGLGGQFVHVELATFVRTNAPTRTKAADAAAAAILRFRTNAPGAPGTFSLVPQAPVNGNVVWDVPTVSRHPYFLEFRTNLSSGSWQRIYALPGEGTARRFTNAVVAPSGFYRVAGE